MLEGNLRESIGILFLFLKSENLKSLFNNDSNDVDNADDGIFEDLIFFLRNFDDASLGCYRMIKKNYPKPGVRDYTSHAPKNERRLWCPKQCASASNDVSIGPNSCLFGLIIVNAWQLTVSNSLQTKRATVRLY